MNDFEARQKVNWFLDVDASSLRIEQGEKNLCETRQIHYENMFKFSHQQRKKEDFPVFLV